MKKLFAILFFAMLTGFVAAQVSKTIEVPTAGTLSTLLTANEKTTVTNLTLTGNIDARDFVTMRDAMPALSGIDISTVQIHAYDGFDGTNPYNYSYLANEIPPYFSCNQLKNTYKTKLKTIILPETITSIGESAFLFCGLTNVTIPNAVTKIGDFAFRDCGNLSTITFGNSLVSIGIYSFINCVSLTSLTLPNSLTTIKESAFNSCYGLTTVTIPNSVTTIGAQAFRTCNGLTSLTIGRNVTLIGNQAFEYCQRLKKIICLNPVPPAVEADSIQGITPKDVYVPVGSVEAYKSAPGWTNFPKISEYKLIVYTYPVGTVGSSVQLNALIELIADTPIISYGFCWNTSGSPTIADNIINKGTTSILGKYSNTLSNLAQATKYYVKAFVTDGERTVYGDEVSFTTSSIPVTAGVISGSATVCQGQNSVTYSVPTVTNATSYSWTLPSGVTGASITNSITVNYSRTAVSGEITVKGHNEWGDGASSTLAITTSLLPANAGTISGNTSVCQGENSITYTVPLMDNATSYSWTLPTGATGTSTSNNIIVSYSKTALPGNITVKGHNDCGDGVASTLAITVNQIPVIEASDTAVTCGGTIPLYTYTNYTGSGKLRYKWTPSTGLSNDTIEFPAAIVSSRTTYTVTVTTPAGCTVSKDITVSILPMAQPQIGIVGVSSDKNRIVWNKPVSTGIESYFIYRETNISNAFEKIGTVSFDSLSVFVDNQSAPDVKSNKYRLSILDRNGLESPQSDPHKTMHLSINKGMNNTWNLIWEPYEGFSVSTYNIYRGTNANNMNFLDATSGSSTQFSDKSAITGDVYYQLEVICPNLINPSKSSSAILKSKESGSAITSTFGSYSSSRSNIATNVISGINAPEGGNYSINIFPNPVKNELRIDFEGGTSFEILNLMGQVVFNGNLINSKTVQTSNLSSGVYLIKFKIGNSFEYKKIIKE